MNKWFIDIYLKSGRELRCLYHGREDNSTDVANKLFGGKVANEVIGLANSDGRRNTFVVVGEVAAYDIYV